MVLIAWRAFKCLRSMMRIQLYEFVGLLCVCLLCAVISSYRYAQVKKENNQDLRVTFADAEQWMIQSLPGIGPVKSAEIIAARDAGTVLGEVKWPKRSQPYLMQLFKAADEK